MKEIISRAGAESSPDSTALHSRVSIRAVKVSSSPSGPTSTSTRRLGASSCLRQREFPPRAGVPRLFRGRSPGGRLPSDPSSGRSPFHAPLPESAIAPGLLGRHRLEPPGAGEGVASYRAATPSYASGNAGHHAGTPGLHIHAHKTRRVRRWTARAPTTSQSDDLNPAMVLPRPKKIVATPASTTSARSDEPMTANRAEHQRDDDQHRGQERPIPIEANDGGQSAHRQCQNCTDQVHLVRPPPSSSPAPALLPWSERLLDPAEYELYCDRRQDQAHQLGSPPLGSRCGLAGGGVACPDGGPGMISSPRG